MTLLVLLFLLTSDILPPYPLQQEPIGWQSLRYAQTRDSKYHGITFDVSLDLTFIKRAADYIRTVYEVQGVEGVVRLTVFERNANDYRPEEVYSGRLNLVNYSTTERGVSVPVEETGFAKKLLTLDDVPVDIVRPASQGGAGLPPLVLEQVQMHSQPIVKRTEFGPTTYQAAAAGAIATDDALLSTIYFGFGTASINELGVYEYQSGFVADSVPHPTLPGIRVHGPPEPLFTAQGNGIHEIAFRIDSRVEIDQVAGGGGLENLLINYYYQVEDGPMIDLTQRGIVTPGGSYAQDIVVEYSASPTLRIGQKVYLYGWLQIGAQRNAAGVFQFPTRLRLAPGSYLRISATTRTLPTPCDGLLVYEALERTLSSITDTPRPLYSEYYGRTDTATPYPQDGPGSLRLLTDSWRLRNFPTADKPFTLSFRDVYDLLDAQDCIGMGLEVRDGRQVVRIEPRAYFYQAATQALSLGNLLDLKKTLAADLIFNTAAVGYEAWKSGSESGLAEPNGRRTYTLPITQSKGAYEALSKASASGYLIEETRRDTYTVAPNKENGGDGTLFIVALRRTASGLGYLTERGEAFSTVSGVLAPADTYNLRLTPARMLRRHLAWLRIGLLHQDERALVLAASEGSTTATTQLLSETEPVAEGADVPVSAMPAPLFFPERYEGSTTLRPAQLRQLRRQPYGLVQFLDGRGRTLSGFVERIEIEPASRRATLTLLRYS